MVDRLKNTAKICWNESRFWRPVYSSFFGMMAFFFFPGLMIFLFVGAFIGFGVIIPVQAFSMQMAIRMIFKEDVDFKSAYFLMGIVLFVTFVILLILESMGINPFLAYVAQFIVGALIIGLMVQTENAP